ncbi:MAG: A24 family peptidase [Chromatiales bacterium]|jgi:leader peptidase (prepilin peptidase)/N-methyltransferase
MLLDFFQLNPLIFYICVFVFSLAIGSFLNVVIYRLPEMMQRQWQRECDELDQQKETSLEQDTFNLSVPASRCPACGHKIRAWENIPVISYLLLKGKCSGCESAISLRYPIIEITTALLALVIAMHFGVTTQTLAALLLTYSLIALSMIDFDHHLLPDNITLPMIWIGLAINMGYVYTDIESAVIGAMSGYLSLWSVFWLFKLLTGKEGMGYGDFKLLALFGAWLGWQYLPLIILLSSLVGAVIGIGMIVLRGRDRNIPIPFGPYLAIAGWIALLYGEQINNGYLQLAGIR